MSSNRPFFANFLAAFRAHTAIQQASSASTSAANATVASQSARSSVIPSSSARTISTSTKVAPHPSSTAVAAVQTASHLQSTRQHSTSPISRSPRSPVASPPGHFGGSSGQRRDSSSSSEGFRDLLGSEKWYIGGRNAAGEERFYRLGMARRHRSIDRLSLDRLSL